MLSNTHWRDARVRRANSKTLRAATSFDRGSIARWARPGTPRNLRPRLRKCRVRIARRLAAGIREISAAQKSAAKYPRPSCLRVEWALGAPASEVQDAFVPARLSRVARRSSRRGRAMENLRNDV